MSLLSRRSLVVALLLVFVSQRRVVHGCGAAGSSQILTNPQMTLKFNPPTSWTYPTQTATLGVAYFPGQSMTQSDANLRAQGDMTAATLEGLNAIGVPSTTSTITVTYTAPQVNDCVKSTDDSATATPAGSQFGVERRGAIINLASSSAVVAVADCISQAYVTSSGTLTYTTFVQQAIIKIDNLVLSEYEMNMVAAKVSSVLMLNSNVDFTEEIVVS